MRSLLVLSLLCLFGLGLSESLFGSNSGDIQKVGTPGAVPVIKDSKAKTEDAEYIEAVLRCFVNGEFKKDLSPACKKIHDDQAKALEKAMKFVPPVAEHQKAEEKSHDLFAARQEKQSFLEMLSSTRSEGLAKSLRKRRKTPYASTKLWKRGLINYAFGGTTSVSDMGKRAIAAMKSWMEVTCIRFKLDASAANKVTFEKDAADQECSCSVGEGASQACTLSHGGQNWPRDGTNEIGCPQGTLVHELGHVLGLSHTHNRIDRDKYFTVAVTSATWDKNDHSKLNVNYAKKDGGAGWKDAPLFPADNENTAVDNLFSSQMCYTAQAADGSKIQSKGTDATRLAKLKYPDVKDEALPAKVLADADARSKMWQRKPSVPAFDAASVNTMYQCAKIKLSCAVKSPALSVDLHVSKTWQWGDFVEVVKSVLVPAQIDATVADAKFRFAVGSEAAAAAGGATDALPEKFATNDAVVTVTVAA